MFLPTTREEVERLGWDGLDVILVSGDTYIDSPFCGVAVIGKVLLAAGYRVGIIAQPDCATGADISRLGESRLFWGVTGGCVDSLVANYTASGKRRKSDDFTPGGRNTSRPDRAVIVYTNLIKQHFKGTKPIVLGGIEASLRRIAHYDFWSDSIRRTILLDAKADYLLYGMADRTVVQFAETLAAGNDPRSIRGLCYLANEPPADAESVLLPAYEEVKADKDAFIRMFRLFYENNDPVQGRLLVQPYGNRYLVLTPPPLPLTEKEIDAVFGLEFEREVHPYYAKMGAVPAMETIRFAITTHRGCYGECNFCAIAVHQGRTVQSRSLASIKAEAEACSRHPRFKGMIHDVGGPTANMYGIECAKKKRTGSCQDRRCLFPRVCPSLRVDHGKQLQMLAELRKLKKIKKVVVASGIRHDMVAHDRKQGGEYLAEVVTHHVSGQMKVAPEHTEERVLQRMGKPESRELLLRFRELFQSLSQRTGKRQFLTYYFVAAHPGCTAADMDRLAVFVRQELKLRPEQVQIFTPTPSTYSTLMYCTGIDPFSGEAIFVEKSGRGRDGQKEQLTGGRVDSKGSGRKRR